MDDNIRELDPIEFPVANLLSRDSTLEDTLNITIERNASTCNRGERLKGSITHHKALDSDHLNHKVAGLAARFHYNEETGAITDFFNKTPQMNPVSLRFANILTTQDTAKDVVYRQEGVKELARNKRLTRHLADALSHRDLFYFEDGFSTHNLNVLSQFTPEKLKRFLDGVEALETYNPQSGPILKALSWVRQLKEDTLFSELYKTKRKITDSRIFTVYTERYNSVKYGILKPGVKPEEVFDFIGDDLITKEFWNPYDYEIDKKKWQIVKHKTPEHKKREDLIFNAARQKMNEVNEMTADRFMTQTLLIYIQLAQLYQGAAVHDHLKRNNFPISFPEIETEPGHIEARHAMPLRLLLNDSWSRDKSKGFCYNDFRFPSDDRIIQAEGPNNSGKSEAWRTIHLMNYFINAGYPVPAKYCRWSIFPESHFISCKGDSGHGGSELANSKRQIFDRLAFVRKGDLVILDELGDATNQYTARALGDETLGPLLDFGCKILITSHHDALTKNISEKYNGVSLMPDPNGSGIERYRLVPVKNNNIDFRSKEMLDEIGWTKEHIKKILGTGGTLDFMDERSRSRYIHPNDDLPF